MLCLSGLNTFTVSGVIMRPANWLLEGGGGGVDFSNHLLSLYIRVKCFNRNGVD